MSDAPLSAEIRRMTGPVALVRNAEVRKTLLLDLAKRVAALERALAAARMRRPATPVTVTGSAPVPVERKRGRRVVERLDPMAEIRRVLAEETADVRCSNCCR